MKKRMSDEDIKLANEHQERMCELCELHILGCSHSSSTYQCEGSRCEDAIEYLKDALDEDKHNEMEDKEYILCSAVNFDNVLIVGYGCGSILETMLKFNQDVDPRMFNNNQGFITSSGRFVDREEGYKIAHDNIQIKYNEREFSEGKIPYLMSINLFNLDDENAIEYILCASINYKGTYIHGYRHGTCYDALRKLAPKITEDELPTREQQGFLTSKNRYVSRKEAWKIAKAQKQIRYGEVAAENGEDSILISENLY